MRKANLLHKNVWNRLNGPHTAIKKNQRWLELLVPYTHVNGATDWETAHLKVRNAICDYIAKTNTNTGTKGSMYLANTKMISLTTEGTDVVLMAPTQVLGINIYIYHKWVKKCKWLKCDHPSNHQDNIPLKPWWKWEKCPFWLCLGHIKLGQNLDLKLSQLIQFSL